MGLNITYNLKSNRRTEPFVPKDTLPFGKLVSDHMFVMDYVDGRWQDERIEEFGPMPVWPNAVHLHYPPNVFEGAKAFEHPDQELYTFRFKSNAERMNIGASTMQMPEVPAEMQMEAVHTLLDIDRLWFPKQENASLYIRPFLFPTEKFIGVRPGITHRYVVFLSPSGPYYKSGLNPTTMWMTHSFKRTVPFPNGHVPKAGALYGLSLQAKQAAKKQGAEQALYTSVDGEFLTEVGSMNHYQVQSGEVILPPFSGEILRSITATSMIELALMGRLNFPVVQRNIPARKFIEDLLLGRISEAGGLGTAAVVAPVGKYIIEPGFFPSWRVRTNAMLMARKGRLHLSDKPGPMTLEMRTLLTDIQYGRAHAPEGWLEKVEKK
jgi:branched-chain amino acid aminotransferase